jgi:spoIIIJ-associated protein
MQSVDQEGKTLDEALEKAISSLKCTKDDIEYEILDEGSKGVLGIGARPLLVRVRLKEDVLKPKENLELRQDSSENTNINNENKNKETNVESSSSLIINNEETEKIKNLLNSFCNSLSLDLKNVVFFNENDNIKINIETDDANLLIGKHGKTLESLQYLINQIMHQEKSKFLLDISNYRVKQNEKLVSLIRSIAEKVKTTKRKITLNPMSSSDRKVVHEVIKEYPGLITKSIGVEPNRKVVIQYASSNKNTIKTSNFRNKNFNKDKTFSKNNLKQRARNRNNFSFRRNNSSSNNKTEEKA